MPTNSHSATRTPLQANPSDLPDDRSKNCTARLNFDIPDAVLAEVDFKWLMSGLGHRVDPKRFYVDQAYTMVLLQSGLRSESAALRECAASLLQKIETASTVEQPFADVEGIPLNDRDRSPGACAALRVSTGRAAQGHRQATQSEPI